MGSSRFRLTSANHPALRRESMRVLIQPHDLAIGTGSIERSTGEQPWRPAKTRGRSTRGRGTKRNTVQQRETCVHFH